MNSDEELARRLQAEFDEEARAAEEQVRHDASFAQDVASQSHDVSESDEEIEEISQGARHHVMPHVSTRKLQVLDVDTEDGNKAVLPKINNSPHKKVSSRNVKEHNLSDEDEPSTSQTSKEQNVSVDSQKLPNNDITKSQEEKVKKRPLCKFGSACYRKNPWHLEEFYHPHLDYKGGGTTGNSNRENSRDEGSEPPKKKPKDSAPDEATKKSISSKMSFPSRLAASKPFNLFLNKSFSIKETHEDPLTLVFPDLLNSQLGEVVESVQLNFMVDLDFLMSNYKAGGVDRKPLLVMYGEMEGDPKDYSSLTCVKVNLPFLYGTHHTKMMIFQYQDGLRVVVHTANLVPDDWYEKTQGFWVSPVFPVLENGKSGLLDGESPTRFKRDLIEYLLSYKAPDLTRWSNIIKKYDFSSCNVVFVGSTPGYHIGEYKDRWGHMKVRRIIRQHASTWKSSSPIIVQCSSIGSLGKDAKSWLSGELGISFTGAAALCPSPPLVNVVYPSEDDVRNSSQGWMGGSCLPYNSATHEKQTWLLQHFHVWRSEKRKRTRVMPHIKTYTRLNKSCSSAQFLLLTSANLSKAAWGMLQKQNTQLFIRSYEAGVLILPKFLNDGEEFNLSLPGTPDCLSLPYDVPLAPYPDGTMPWLMNTSKKQPDIFGRTYP
ncbi:probable tyrosyl-DNA phosphodiesterase [Procambarus clarkii]|uniref:probable tyrosyl-DNA phosphodiesterase n=1 Tax=Procambarus clarkii TaxID=6728 RepID=UPI001E673D09|nr:probable tyrosyl-DNA phosphodiesterase [Procambarus clarkii]